MIADLLTPFDYDYMRRAILLSTLVGGLCGLFSAFLILKGWALIGDALSHAVVPGVAIAYALQLPFAFGAFVSGLFAAAAMAFLRSATALRDEAVVGLVFTSFFAFGLLIISLEPASVDLQAIVLGNILAIGAAETAQLLAIAAIVLAGLALKGRDLVLVFFDETQARALGLPVRALQAGFLIGLSGAVIAALQTVGAVLVIAMLVTPGATAHLLADRFGAHAALSCAIGAGCGGLGAYLSFFLDGATGGLIVCLLALVFAAAFLFAPRHGLFAARAAGRR